MKAATFHGKACARCGGTLRYVRDNRCYACRRAYVRINDKKHSAVRRAKQAAYLKANRDAINARNRAKAAANRDAVRAKKKVWRDKNKEALRAAYRKKYEQDTKDAEIRKARSTQWRLKNRDWHLVNLKKWRVNNPGRANALTAARRAAKIQAAPKWLTDEHRRQIQAIYAEAARLTRETGIKWSVDHIVPLRGRTVCGLHIPANLRVIPLVDNMKKGNKILA